MPIFHRIKFILPLLLIPAVLVAIWFKNGFIHGGGEEGILFYNPEKVSLLSQSVWAEHGTGMYIVGWLQRAPVMYLSFISEKNGIPPVLFQLILFYGLLVIGVLAVYYLTTHLLDEYKGKNSVALISALFYLFNPFAFSQVWGRSLSTQYFAFALLPLTLLLFCLGIKTRKYIYGLLIALISTVLATAFEFLTFIVVYWLVMLIYLVYRVAISKERVREMFFGFSFIFFTFILWLIFNLWWFVPLLSSLTTVYSATVPESESLGTLLGVSRSFPPEVIIRLLQKGYFFDASAYSQIYSMLPFQLISLLPVSFVLIGLFKIFRSNNLMKFRFFLVLLAWGLIVSLGANPPFGWLFVWVFEHITPLQAFRNPFEKFGLVYVLGYCPLFAYGLVCALEKVRRKNLGLLVVLFLTCGIYAWPMWSGRVIAGSDKKIGLDVPTYYKDLRNFLKDKSVGYRLLMTPIWTGDGAYYQWNNAGRYQGSDPMIYMMDQPVISNGAKGAYFYDFYTNLRNYMQRVDVAPALSLLRAKFLIDRKDAIFITDNEKDQYKYLSSVIYPPQGIGDNFKKICQDITVDNKKNDLAWISCHIPPENSNLSNIKYLHLKVKTDKESSIIVSMRDSKDHTITWSGLTDAQYSGETNYQYRTLPLSVPTANSAEIDFSKISLIEVWANLKDNPEKSVAEIDLSEIQLDPGVQKSINEFNKVAEFGKLVVFEPTNFNPPPEFGSLSSIDVVADFVQLFEEINKKRDQTDKTGFVLVSQNPKKNLEDLSSAAALKVDDKYKVSDTRYWLKVGNDKTGLLLLSKTFNPQWKVLPGLSKDKLSGNFFDDLSLLKRIVLSEDSHYVVNGYANLWKIDGKENEYAIVFMPQIIAGIALKISIYSVALMVGVLILLGVKKYRKNKVTKYVK